MKIHCPLYLLLGNIEKREEQQKEGKEKQKSCRVIKRNTGYFRNECE